MQEKIFDELIKRFEKEQYHELRNMQLNKTRIYLVFVSLISSAYLAFLCAQETQEHHRFAAMVLLFVTYFFIFPCSISLIKAWSRPEFKIFVADRDKEKNQEKLIKSFAKLNLYNKAINDVQSEFCSESESYLKYMALGSLSLLFLSYLP